MRDTGDLEKIKVFHWYNGLFTIVYFAIRINLTFDLFCDVSTSSLVEIDRYFVENSFMLRQGRGLESDDAGF